VSLSLSSHSRLSSNVLSPSPHRSCHPAHSPLLTGMLHNPQRGLYPRLTMLSRSPTSPGHTIAIAWVVPPIKLPTLAPVVLSECLKVLQTYKIFRRDIVRIHDSYNSSFYDMTSNLSSAILHSKNCYKDLANMTSDVLPTNHKIPKDVH
jgi:hypothetical protein